LAFALGLYGLVRLCRSPRVGAAVGERPEDASTADLAHYPPAVDSLAVAPQGDPAIEEAGHRWFLLNREHFGAGELA
jgi:hypothetical protein